MQALEELKQLVFEGSFDAESRGEVEALEQRLSELAAKEQLAEAPVFAEYIKWLSDEVERCNLLLQNDRKLTDRERDALFERKDVCDRFLSVFNGGAKRDVESAIRAALARAKSA